MIPVLFMVQVTGNLGDQDLICENFGTCFVNLEKCLDPTTWLVMPKIKSKKLVDNHVNIFSICLIE